MYININNKEKFLQFALDEHSTIMNDGEIFKTIQNGITFIADGNFASEIVNGRFDSKIQILGFVFNGRFYSTHYTTENIDLNFHDEVKQFEDNFNNNYAEAVKYFSLDNLAPVTEKTKEDEHRSGDFEYYCKYQAKEDAKRELFGIKYKLDNTYNTRKFTPIFFDCLKHPENYAGYVQTAIEENANIINYRIKCNDAKQKALESLKADADIMYKWNMYQALKGINGKTVKMTCTLYGENFELSIDRENLMRSLWTDDDISKWNFTSTVSGKIEQAAMKAGYEKYQVKIMFTDIQKITYGKKVLFEKED